MSDAPNGGTIMEWEPIGKFGLKGLVMTIFLKDFVPGQGIPKVNHIDFEFTRNGNTTTFSLDDWTNHPDDHLTGAIAAHVVTAEEARTVLESWTCYTSLFDEVLRYKFFKGESCAAFCNNNAAPFGFDVAAPHDNLHEAVDNDNKYRIFKLLTIGAVVVYYRERTAQILNIADLTIDGRNIHLNWDLLIRSFRKTVRGLCMRNSRPPSYDAAGKRYFDQYLLEELRTMPGGFRALVDGRVIRPNQANNGYECRLVGSDIGAMQNGNDGDIHKALNHLRFIVYVEWRMIWELRSGAVLPDDTPIAFDTAELNV